MMADTGRIPVYLVAGFLGSGKTTLINAILEDHRAANTGLIVNEFADESIDHQIVTTPASPTILPMPGGCLCCEHDQELNGRLTDISADQPDRILIELSGLANPGAVARTLLSDAYLSQLYRIAGTFTLIDARTADLRLERFLEARHQIVHADKIIVTRLPELASRPNEHAARLQHRIWQLNPSAQIIAHEAIRSPADLLFEEISPATRPTPTAAEASHGSTELSAIILRSSLTATPELVSEFCETAANRLGNRLIRLKGFVRTENRSLLVQGIGGMFDEPVDAQRQPTCLVAILPKDEQPQIQAFFDAFLSPAKSDTPDRKAIRENPLAVPGIRF